MINKLIAVLLALSIALSCLFVPSFASPLDVSSDFSRFITDIWTLSEQYDKGEISKSEYISSFGKSMLRFDINYGADVTSFKDVLKVFEFCGVELSDDWKEWFYENKMGGDGDGGHRDDSELKGYGAILKIYNSKGTLNTVYYGDYGIFRNIKETQFDVLLKYTHIAKYDYNSGDFLSENDVDSSIAFTHYIPDSNGLRQYLGDWRNSDGSSNDDFTTEFPEKVPPTFDDDSVSDDDLIDFLKDLLEKLQMQFPDLSTIEGLLRAILAKCTDIENRIGEGGNGLTAAELQPLLDQAVLALTLQNKTNNEAVLASNDELLKELINIRKILQGFDSDEEVPPEEADSILQGLISGLTSGLISLIGSGFGDVEVSEIIEICTSAGMVGTKLLSGIVDIIGFLGALVPFSIIKTCIESTFNIMFNKNTPVDLTFTLDGDSYTFLSASFFDIPIVAGSLAILKGVVTIMVLYGWLKWARKFYINLM